MSKTTLQMIRHVADKIGLAEGEADAGGSTTTLIDAGSGALQSLDDAKLFVNAWIMPTAGTPGNIGKVRRITGYDNVTHTLTFAPALPAAVVDGDTYMITFGLPAKRLGIARGILDYINDALRDQVMARIKLITLVADGDMETTPSAWTPTDCTGTKTNTQVVAGKQAIYQANTGVGGYLESAAFSVIPGKTYEVIADCRPVAGTPSIAFDNAAITPITNRVDDVLYGTITIPAANGGSLKVRLTGAEAGALIYWENVTVREEALRAFFYPHAGFTTHEYGIGAIGQLRGTRIAERHFKSMPWQRVSVDQLYRRLEWFPSPSPAYHLCYEDFRPFTEFSLDTDSTDANADWLRAHALFLYFRDRGNKEQAALYYQEAQDLDARYAARRRGARLRLPEVY